MDEMRERLGAEFYEAVRETLTADDRTLTASERRAHGVALRKNVSRSSHATWTPAFDRPDPVYLLKVQGETRVKELLPLRYERMSASAFAFYRGAALIMATDLSHTPSCGIEVQACGDAHISNFGFYTSPERRTVFDINDFDETSRGPWEWDVKRLATSVEICARERGFKRKERNSIVLACVQSYRESMEEFANMGNMDMWYAHADIDKILEEIAGADTQTKKSIKAERLAKHVEKAKGKNNARAIAKFTEVVDGQLRIVSDPPVLVPLREMAARLGKADYLDQAAMEHVASAALITYCRSLAPDKRRLMELYHGVDIAQKVVGVGSVGTRALIVVMEGAAPDDYLVLQVKEAQESVLERFCGKSAAHQHGQRVVEGQRVMQTASDMLLGWCQIPSIDGSLKDFYVRQLWDGKGSIDLERIGKRPLRILARACGRTLAHAHARTGDRFAIAGYLGKSDKFDRAIAQFARAYADQNEVDYERFLRSLDSGELA